MTNGSIPCGWMSLSVSDLQNFNLDGSAVKNVMEFCRLPGTNIMVVFILKAVTNTLFLKQGQHCV